MLAILPEQKGGYIDSIYYTLVLYFIILVVVLYTYHFQDTVRAHHAIGYQVADFRASYRGETLTFSKTGTVETSVYFQDVPYMV